MLDLDVSLFYWINSHFQSPMMEKFMGFLSLKQNFLVPGVIVALAIIWAYRWRGFMFLITAGIFVGLNDFISHQLIKETVARPRPCHVLEGLNHLAFCSNSFSFPSNHASNTFTFATLSALCFKYTVLLVYALALLIGYSRVYLGVHYPSDILGGFICGIVMGYLGYLFYQKLLNRIRPSPSRP